MAQRALIALALVNDPALLIADEPTTGLDVTIQAEILDLMSELVASKGSSIWIITHDLGVIANYTQRAGVMFAGEVVELGPTSQLFADPQHPYTRGLVESMQDAPTSDRMSVSGAAPDLLHRPVGCQFAYRCPIAEPISLEARPVLEDVRPGHSVRCAVVQRDAAERVR
jgi:peptide/nickel transport system ATP-binding protein